jgi:hypothetical protein
MFEFLLQCHMPDRTLVRYRAGLLDTERSDALEAHLLLCPTCQLQFEDLLPPAMAGGLLPAAAFRSALLNPALEGGEAWLP